MGIFLVFVAKLSSHKSSTVFYAKRNSVESQSQKFNLMFFVNKIVS